MRALLVAAFCVALAACAGSQVRQVSTVKASGEAQNACPTGKEEPTPEMCANLPEGYGLTAEYPAERGGLAMGRPHYGRLLCADGSRPEHVAKGTIVEPPRPSTSPPSPIAKQMRQSETPDPRRDFIDAWNMRCGGETVVLYTNAYRCGSPFVPKTFKLLPLAAHQKQNEAFRNLREGSLDDALASIEAALAIDESAQPLYETKLQILLQRKEYE